MTERGGDGPTPDFADDTVSRRYRDLADDGSPGRLDRQIRTEARGAVRGPAWQRPLAVAATLALAAAIVLEVTGPRHDAAREEAPAVAPATIGDRGRGLPAPELTPEVEPESAPAAGNVSRFASPAALAPPSGVARKSEMAHDEGVSAEESVSVGAETPAPYEARGANGSSPCASERDSPAAWLECIEKLAAAGDDMAASAERRALAERYPEAAASPD
ncbi:MAG: hypothetical protein P8172_02260 [Gammaproteobacteria bacterium]|jgi:hypothetical protein